MKTKKQINIFIVEDNKLFTMALKTDIETSFSNMPIKIFSFETGEACMKIFKEIKPQVVILDYLLNSRSPNAADGIKVLDWIKKANNNTNVIMLTSDDKIDIAIKSFMHGASDYVVKTETQFRKINYSLLNIFKIMKAKSDARMAKRAVTVATVLFAIFIVGVTIYQILYR